VLLGEFHALRAEHDMRVGKQQDISQLALGLLGVSVGVVGALAGRGGGVDEVRGLFPLLAGVLSGLMLMTLDHEMNIVHIQIYVQKHLSQTLRDALRLGDIEDVPFWRWVRFRAGKQQHPGFPMAVFTLGIASAKYWLTLGPSFLLLFAFPFLCSGRHDAFYAWVGYAIAVLIWLFAASASIVTGRLYLQMDHDRDW
jgi:heme exporter protein D